MTKIIFLYIILRLSNPNGTKKSKDIFCNENIFEIYFTAIEVEANCFTCNACKDGKKHKQDKLKGFTNAARHVTSIHLDWKEIVTKAKESELSGSIEKYFAKKISPKEFF